jgi:hypothetical protein
VSPARRGSGLVAGVALTVLAGCGGASPLAGMLGPDTSGMPRQSPAAGTILYLASNVNCEFFVDGQSMITGRTVKILVTTGPHRVVCKPEGYRAKEEDIRPPYDPNHPIRFTFLLEDRL